MKVVLTLIVLLTFLAMPAFAETTTRGQYTTPCPQITNFLNTNNYVSHTHAVTIDDTRLVTGLKLDAPNLIRLSNKFTIGVEGSKDVYNNPFMDNNSWVEDDKGYSIYLKATYTGTWLDFRK